MHLTGEWDYELMQLEDLLIRQLVSVQNLRQLVKIMAPCKSSAADGDPGLRKPLHPFKRRLVQLGDHCIEFIDLMTPGKRSAEGNHNHQLKKWTSLFKSSTKGGLSCKLKELPHMMVEALEMWLQR
jgi:hypothetical protein